jgi:hypothetical protein
VSGLCPAFAALLVEDLPMASVRPLSPATANGVGFINPTRSQRRVCFAIYYYSKDGAFERAAKTWEREIEIAKLSGNGVIQKVVLTEGTFAQAWNEIYQAVTSGWAEGELRINPVTTGANGLPNWSSWEEGPQVVTEGHIFSHASVTGLEFKPLQIIGGQREDGTFTREQIQALPRMPWDPLGGQLVLHGCHTGEPNPRNGEIVGRIFAEAQQVKTIGQKGSANFSRFKQVHVPINDGIRDVYLWAFNDPVNMPPGQRDLPASNRFARPGVVFEP